MPPKKKPQLKRALFLTITNIRVAVMMKTENIQFERREIARYLVAGKVERARVKVEQVIREDNMLAAMELVEGYCDLVRSQFGLLKLSKQPPEGLAEAISSLLYAAPRMSTDLPELIKVSNALSNRYGKNYASACRGTGVLQFSKSPVDDKLIEKLDLKPARKVVVETYLSEIAEDHGLD